jgi:hypothetical protein
MSNLIEEIDRKQRRLFKGFLIAFFLALALLVVRAIFYYGLGEYELNSQPIGIAVLVVTIITVVIAAYFVIMLGILKSKINSDPKLREALIENELAKLYAVESWRSAFIGAVVTPFVFLFISSFYTFCDLLTVALTTAVVGSATYLVSFNIKGRS